MGAVVFLDTETTKRERGYRPWDIALIRREISGEERPSQSSSTKRTSISPTLIQNP